DDDRAYARRTPQSAVGLESGPLRAVGGYRGPEHGRGDPGDPGITADCRAVVSLVSGCDGPSQEKRGHGPARRHVHPRAGSYHLAVLPEFDHFLVSDYFVAL